MYKTGTKIILPRYRWLGRGRRSNVNLDPKRALDCLVSITRALFQYPRWLFRQLRDWSTLSVLPVCPGIVLLKMELTHFIGMKLNSKGDLPSLLRWIKATNPALIHHHSLFIVVLKLKQPATTVLLNERKGWRFKVAASLILAQQHTGIRPTMKKPITGYHHC